MRQNSSLPFSPRRAFRRGSQSGVKSAMVLGVEEMSLLSSSSILSPGRRKPRRIRYSSVPLSGSLMEGIHAVRSSNRSFISPYHGYSGGGGTSSPLSSIQ